LSKETRKLSNMWKRPVYAMVEAIVLGERYKPIQKCIRRCLVKYNVIGLDFDRRASAIVYNVFRNLGLNDRIIEDIAGVNVKKVSPKVRGALRLITYIYQVDERSSRDFKRLIRRYTLSYLSGVLKPKELEFYKEIVDKITKEKWKPTNVNDEIILIYRISPNLYNALKKALEALNEDLDAFLRSTLKPPPHTLRVNRLKAEPSKIIQELLSLGCNVRLGRYCRNAIIVEGGFHKRLVEMIEKGILIPQDEASMIAVELLNPREGMEIADLCAAPGGKTTYLAELSKLKSRIYSFEIFKDRAKRLMRLLERTGTSSKVKVYVMDAREAVNILGEESMDLVLIDPPCSSTGALAKNPDVRWRYDESAMSEIVKLQADLLEVGWKLLKPNGKMLYTTCSVLPWENEYLIKDFMNKHGKAKLIALSKPFKKSPILQETMRAWPHIHGVTGFFYALIKKP